jgi:hypothetical protein
MEYQLQSSPKSPGVLPQEGQKVISHITCLRVGVFLCSSVCLRVFLHQLSRSYQISSFRRRTLAEVLAASGEMEEEPNRDADEALRRHASVACNPATDVRRRSRPWSGTRRRAAVASSPPTDWRLGGAKVGAAVADSSSAPSTYARRRVGGSTAWLVRPRGGETGDGRGS